MICGPLRSPTSGAIWYDFTIEAKSDRTFQRIVAGHVETGEDSVSDPALGG